MSICDDYVAILAHKYLRVSVSSDSEVLLRLVVSHFEHCVIEMNILPKLEMIHILLDVLMEFVHSEEGVVRVGGRREVHECHRLDGNVSYELSVG